MSSFVEILSDVDILICNMLIKKTHHTSELDVESTVLKAECCTPLQSLSADTENHGSFLINKIVM